MSAPALPVIATVTIRGKIIYVRYYSSAYVLYWKLVYLDYNLLDKTNTAPTLLVVKPSKFGMSHVVLVRNLL